MTSVQDWIARQDWPDVVKDEALELLASRERMRLNPLTGSQWRSWAGARGLTLKFQ